MSRYHISNESEPFFIIDQFLAQHPWFLYVAETILVLLAILTGAIPFLRQ